jgi:hypothetical protein
LETFTHSPRGTEAYRRDVEVQEQLGRALHGFFALCG